MNPLEFTTSIVEACGHHEPPPSVRKRITRRQGNDVVSSGAHLWSVQVPGKDAVRMVLAYAREPWVTLNIGGVQAAKATIESARAVSDGLVVRLGYTLGAGDIRYEAITYPYPDDLSRRLASGNWTQVGSAEFKFGSDLLPHMEEISGGQVAVSFSGPVHVRWKGFGILGLFRRITQTRIDSIVMDEYGAAFRTNSMFNWLLPRLEWT